MKKVLLAVVCCVLCVSISVHAKEYKKEETRKCVTNYGKRLGCDLNGNLITGIVKSYYENGNLKDETPYKDGKIEGIGKTYYKNGKLKDEAPIKEGMLNGVVRSYYENGQLKQECPYKNNKKEGLRKVYYRDGVLREEISFKGDKLDGLSRAYSAKNGIILYEFISKNGTVVSGYVYDKSGSKKKMMNEQLNLIVKNYKKY